MIAIIPWHESSWMQFRFSNSKYYITSFEVQHSLRFSRVGTWFVTVVRRTGQWILASARWIHPKPVYHIQEWFWYYSPIYVQASKREPSLQVSPIKFRMHFSFSPCPSRIQLILLDLLILKWSSSSYLPICSLRFIHGHHHHADDLHPFLKAWHYVPHQYNINLVILTYTFLNTEWEHIRFSTTCPNWMYS